MNSMWRINPPQSTNPLRFLLFVSRPYRLVAIGALCAVVFAAIIDTGVAFAYKLIVNAVANLTTTDTARELWHGAFLFVSLLFFSQLVWRVSGFLGMRWATGVRATTRYTLTDHVTNHSSQYFSDRFAGSISSKISQASASAKDVTEQVMWRFTAFAVSMTSSFVLMYSANRMVAWIFLTLVVLLTLLNLYLAKKRRPYATATQRSETRLVGMTVDLLTNILAVKEYVGRTFELARLKTSVVDRRTTGLQNWMFAETIMLGNGMIEALFTGSMIFVSVYLALQGRISPGDVALILTLTLLTKDGLRTIGQQINNFTDSWGQIVESLEDILRLHEIIDRPGAGELKLPSPSITLSHISFGYGGIQVFDDFTLHIPPHQKIGLVGRSGSGKSTLTKLLLRNYDLAGGVIRIGDQDISMVTQESLRSVIAVVPQDPLLFHRSIRDNIGYGKPGASQEEIVHAARLAQAHEFIEQLPGGYDALVGERGVKLSGGQRQRVAIARALLKDAPILLLDEATSSLDSESEVAVQKALKKLMGNRTVIAIAHRLSTLRSMDRIVVMDGGKIVEDGTHEELLAKKGLYAELWAHQAGGFLKENGEEESGTVTV